MGTTKGFFTGAILGAGLLYFFDPRTGKRRRKLVADQVHRLSRKAACAVDAGVRDLRNRARGAVHDVEFLVERGKWPTSQRRKLETSSQCACGMSPGSRLIAAGVGTALMANCLARRTPNAVLLGTLGFGMFAKSVDASPSGVHIEKTFEIAAPIDKVFDFLTHPQNYMRVSDVVTNVEVFEDGRFAKTMLIAGIPLRFEERFVRCKEHCLIETESEPRSAMKFSKHLALEEVSHSCTRVRLSFHYHPPGGAIGHAIASAFGIDAKTVLNDLLMRCKYFLETGREPHDAVGRLKSKGRTLPANGGNGSHHGEVGSQLHGAGAPAEDVRRPGITNFEQLSPWPKSEEIVSSESSGEHFPTAKDWA